MPDTKWSMIPLALYERYEDMSRDGFLSVIMEDDGDITIFISDEKFKFASVQFCTVGSGGGRSPKTREALKQLARAIEEDNKENPIVRQKRGE